MEHVNIRLQTTIKLQWGVGYYDICFALAKPSDLQSLADLLYYQNCPTRKQLKSFLCVYYVQLLTTEN